MAKGLFCGTNTPEDPANLTEMEKKHVPVIDCPGTVTAGEPFRVSIRVGELPHVMEEAHHIQWLEIWFSSNFYTRIDLTPVFTVPEVAVTLVRHTRNKTATMRVVERCNMHGQWEATHEITVE